MARITIPKLESSSFKGWTFVLIAGTLLALLAIVDRGGLDEIIPADGSTSCQLEVSTPVLNVRSGPSPGATLVETIPQGTQLDGTDVVTDGFRQLEENRWAADQFLTPLPGSVC